MGSQRKANVFRREPSRSIAVAVVVVAVALVAAANVVAAIDVDFVHVALANETTMQQVER